MRAMRLLQKQEAERIMRKQLKEEQEKKRLREAQKRKEDADILKQLLAAAGHRDWPAQLGPVMIPHRTRASTMEGWVAVGRAW